MGGDHISNDLAYGLKVPLSRAEQLKLEHGSALVEASAKGQTITLANEVGLPTKVLNLEHLRRIMSVRIEKQGAESFEGAARFAGGAGRHGAPAA